METKATSSSIDARKTVLVVDDSPDNIDVIVGLLKGLYRVKAAANGAKALALVKSKSPPDLVLLDIMMPGMDGYEVCRQLKADPVTRTIPIIFLTAKITTADEVKAFDLGAADYITKPVNPPLLYHRVETQLALLDQRRFLEEKVQERTLELQSSRLEVIQRLGKAAEFKDNETGLHVIRMSLYSRLLAFAVGLSNEETDLIFNASPMHDIGKIGIPDSVLLKPGKLNPAEWKIMMTHPQIGAEIIGENHSELLSLARTIALTHHEKWDGTGYPQGLKGTDIPLASRIVAIADVFDAVVSVRPYKKAWPMDKAMNFIEAQAGKHFDPALVPLFLELKNEIRKIHEKYIDKFI